MGTIVESTVLRHLIAANRGQTLQASYWRQPRGSREGGPEVDIVVKFPEGVVPFEVKYRETAPLDAKGGLASFCLAEGVDQGFLVTKSDRDFGPATLEGHPTRFMKVPAHILTYIAGRAELQESTLGG